MISRKQWVTDYTKDYINAMAWGEKLNMLRDIFYSMKDEDFFIHETKVATRTMGEQATDNLQNAYTSIISDTVWEMAEGDPHIYERLGLLEKVNGEAGSIPCTVFFEKRLHQATDLLNKYRLGHVWGRGLITNTEVASIVDITTQAEGSISTLIMVTDHDPAGLQSFLTMRDKVKRFNVKNKLINVVWIWESELWGG